MAIDTVWIFFLYKGVHFYAGGGQGALGHFLKLSFYILLRFGEERVGLGKGTLFILLLNAGEASL